MKEVIQWGFVMGDYKELTFNTIQGVKICNDPNVHSSYLRRNKIHHLILRIYFSHINFSLLLNISSL